MAFTVHAVGRYQAEFKSELPMACSICSVLPDPVIAEEAICDMNTAKTARMPKITMTVCFFLRPGVNLGNGQKGQGYHGMAEQVRRRKAVADALCRTTARLNLQCRIQPRQSNRNRRATEVMDT